jgi:hypothetical protein
MSERALPSATLLALAAREARSVKGSNRGRARRESPTYGASKPARFGRPCRALTVRPVRSFGSPW